MSKAVAGASAVAVVVALFGACTPLPVPERQMWAPACGATDYPGASRDAGADAARTEAKPLEWLDQIAEFR